jgi:hypothetical protein
MLGSCQGQQLMVRSSFIMSYQLVCLLHEVMLAYV